MAEWLASSSRHWQVAFATSLLMKEKGSLYGRERGGEEKVG